MTGVPHGLVVAAPRSGSGKTMLTLGLLRAFRRRGLAVASAKCGPDYIDAAFHAAAAGRACVNLDAWAMPPAQIAALASHAARDADLFVCEGVMGLFDGVPAPPGRSGSTADVAAALGLPVLLVIDASGQSQSAAAIVKGCASYDPRIRVAGVVLNNIASPRHEGLVRPAIEALGIPVLGSLPRDGALDMPERYLGLTQAVETPGLEARLDAVAALVERHVDLDAVRGLAGPLARSAPPRPRRPPGRRVAIARDAAFTFLYPHLLDGWRAAGAEIVFFSPLADEPPPEACDACWLPGGYPELHAARLAVATRFRAGLAAFAATRPVHGECGGYMVLGRTLIDADGVAHPMTGLLGCTTSLAKPQRHLGYREAALLADGVLGRAGQALRGHEHHRASLVDAGGDPPLLRMRDAHGGAWASAGARAGRVTGSFFHLIATDDQASDAPGAARPSLSAATLSF